MLRSALRRRTGAAALVLLLAGCGTSSAAPAAPSAEGMLVVSGPSLAAPTADGETTVAERAGRELGYFVELDAHQDAGLVDGEFRRLPLTYQGGDDAPDPYYDLVLVQAGELDVDAPLREVGVGTAQLLDRLRLLGNPRTRIVLVGPLPGADPVRLAAVRDEMQQVAREKDVPFLDPLVLGWQPGPALAEQLARALRRLGLAADQLSS